MFKVKSYRRLPNGVLLDIPPGKLRIQIFASNVIRVTYSPTSLLPKVKSLIIVQTSFKPVKWEFQASNSGLMIRTNEIQTHVDSKTGYITFYDQFNDIILKEVGREMVKVKILEEEAYHAEEVFMISEEEGLYGLGQHPGIMNYNGHTVTLIQRNWDIAIPFMISSRGYGILWDNYSMTRVSSFKDEEGNKLTWWSEVADVIDYYLIYGPEIDRIISSYRQLTGPSPLLPKWAYGYWQSKERYRTQEEIVNVAKEFRKRKIPIDVIVQDWQYWGRYGWNAFKFDENAYPDPIKMVKELHDMHFHIMISIWPTFGSETEVFREMSKRGYICPNTLCYDPFNEHARNLYWKLIKKAFFDIGIDAWWLDATEPETGAGWASFYTPFHDTKTALGSGARYLNAYSLMTTKAVYEGQRSVSNKRVLILTRSSFAGQQRFAAVSWSGDICHDWGTLKEQIPAGLNFCLSGIPYWTTDIGGFFSGNPESESYKEIFVRWFQWGTFCPIFRVHGTTHAKEPWRFGPKIEKILVKYINLRYRLLPYIYSLAWKVTSEGYTIMRALVMDFQDDPRVFNIDDQFMFGPALMVSPITLPRVSSRKIYLPKASGGWYDFWTGKHFKGGQVIEAPAPLEIIPLHVRAGSIIPLGPLLQYSNEKPLDPIELRIYRGANGSFILYEDEGDNYNYEKGMYSIIPIEWNEAQQKLIIGKRCGRFPGMLKERTFHIVWVREEHGTGVEFATPDRIIHYKGDPIIIEYK